MNYLSHYRLDSSWATPNQILGATLVDLCRLRGKGFRLKALPDRSMPEPLAQLNAGVSRHYAVDAWWHNSTMFKRLQADIKAALAAMNIHFQRQFFFHHIAAEILLDAWLIRHEDAAEEFYAQLGKADFSLVPELLQQTGNSPFADRVEAELQRFMTRKFLIDYKDTTYLHSLFTGLFENIAKSALPLRVEHISNLIAATEPALKRAARVLFDV